VSVLHNPTGYSLTPGSAHRVLKLANEHDFHIVEDDTYSHLAPEHATRLSALDGLQRTIYVSGFAKILAPNWRIGFLAASPELKERLLETKLLATLTTPTLFERALSWCIDQGQLRRHADRIRIRLDGARSPWSIPAWTPTRSPSACSTRATCSRRARSFMRDGRRAR
jgi:DNA-binding transcriptional MocR family regulator